MTLAETTPVNEVVQTAYALEDRVGVRLGPVVVNEIDGLGEPDVPDPGRVDLDGTDGADADLARAGGRPTAAIAGRCRPPRSRGSPASWPCSSGTCRCCRSPAWAATTSTALIKAMRTAPG